MTDIILGLQGEVPAGSRKAVPYVGGKYELYDSKSTYFMGLAKLLEAYTSIRSDFFFI